MCTVPVFFENIISSIIVNVECDVWTLFLGGMSDLLNVEPFCWPTGGVIDNLICILYVEPSECVLCIYIFNGDVVYRSSYSHVELYQPNLKGNYHVYDHFSDRLIFPHAGLDHRQTKSLPRGILSRQLIDSMVFLSVGLSWHSLYVIFNVFSSIVKRIMLVRLFIYIQIKCPCKP